MRTASARFLALGLALVACLPVLGLSAEAGSKEAAASAVQAELTDGVVRKIDLAGKRITLDHAPIKNIGMQAMTMSFRVKDETMLDTVKVGDRIRFAVEKLDGRLVVVRIEPTN